MKSRFSRSGFFCGHVALAFDYISQNEPHVCGTLGKTAHEIRVPVAAIRNIDSHPISLSHQPFLQVSPYPVEHLKLKLVG